VGVGVITEEQRVLDLDRLDVEQDLGPKGQRQDSRDQAEAKAEL
jgi:hypothetical protein